MPCASPSRLLKAEIWEGHTNVCVWFTNSAATRRYPNWPIRAWVAPALPHRSRVDSARAHVCTPTHMNVSINTNFDAPSSTVAAALRLPLLPTARLLARIPVRIAPPSPRCLLLLVVGLLYNSVDDIKGCFYIFFIHFFINIYNMHLIINSY